MNDDLLAAKRGDATALDALLTYYRPWMRVLAEGQVGRRLAGKCDASDVVQIAMMEAFRAFPQFRGESESELLAWLRQVLAHALAHEVRRYAGTRQRDVSREVSLEAELAQSSCRLGSLLAASDSTPSAAAAREEQAVHLAAVLARLPEEYRQVIVLRNLEGLSHEEVAERMERTTGAVRMLWVRALARLRRELEAP